MDLWGILVWRVQKTRHNCYFGLEKIYLRRCPQEATGDYQFFSKISGASGLVSTRPLLIHYSHVYKSKMQFFKKFLPGSSPRVNGYWPNKGAVPLTSAKKATAGVLYAAFLTEWQISNFP